MTKSRATAEHAESAYAWTRLFAALLLSTIGGVGMWSVIVALPAVQAEFGVARSDASLPYTMTMIGVGVGGVLMGRLSDRFGIILPVAGGAISLSVGYVAASAAAEPLAVHARSGPVRGRRQLRDVRAASRRHLALVHPPSGHGGGHLCERQLSRGHGLATDHPALDRERGLAPGARRHRPVLRGDHVAAHPGAEETPAPDRAGIIELPARIVVAATAGAVAAARCRPCWSSPV